MKIVVIQRARRPSFKRPNQSRWVLYAGNGKPLCNSGETYTNTADCVNGLEESLGTLRHTNVLSPEGMSVADRLRRQVRGMKPCTTYAVIDRADGVIVVYDEVRV